MTLKLAFGAIGFVLLSLPFIASLPAHAQENQPQPGAYCPHLTRDLKYGDTDATTGGQVTELQKFLASYYEDFPEDYITGKFRSTTKKFVIRFQTEQNLPAYGYVGPLTRAAIARVCGSQTSPPANQSCQTPWGTTIQSGSSVIAYQSSSVPVGQQCTLETRICTNGNLSGSYQYQTCQVQTTTTTSCTPEQPQTQTLTCPTGQTGSIIQTRYSACPGPTWGPWTTTSNTCTTGTTTTQPPTGACTYKGATYQEGESVPIPGSGSTPPITVLCDNGVWVWSSAVWPNTGQNVCDVLILLPFERTNLGCDIAVVRATLHVKPRHGKVPLTITALTDNGAYDFGHCRAYSLSWGDGTNEDYPQRYCDDTNRGDTRTHTYAAPGAHTISYTDLGGRSNSANVRVDPAGTASIQNQSPNQSQLASALAALESALQAILKLLGQ